MAAALAARDMRTVLTIYRQWTGASQPTIATMTGVPQPTISDVLRGKRQIISLDLFERFARGLDIPRDRLGLAADPTDNMHTPAAPQRFPTPPPTRRRAIGDGIAILTALWQADLDHGVTAGRAAEVDAHLWDAASLDWLLHSTDLTRPAPAPAAGRRIGAADIDAFQTTTNVFADLDNRYGGGHARHALVQFLASDAQAMLSGQYTAEVGRRLFSAVAEAMLLAAWMAYDAGLHGVAQRYFVQALHVAQNADDRPLAGSVLDAMSHQATFLGRYEHAANLARAAIAGTGDSATATLTAHFHAMEARAHARLGDPAACDTALNAAEKLFARRIPDDDPPWIRYFDEAELSAEFGHCFRDLGRAVGARTWAVRSLGAGTDGVFPRSDFFAAMVLADAHLDHGDPEPACRVALSALEIGDQLKSARCAAYVGEFRERLTTVATSRVVRDFTEQAATHRLWAPAA
jgi:transcriptional regulator with XRE-family HTH domain